MAAQECDCDFSTSGDVVFYPEYLEFIEKTTIREPLERRGVDQNMVTKVKFMYENLPSWLKVDYEENNKLTLRLANGSQIKATSASSDAGRSEAVSLLLIDEAAFIENIGEIWASAQQTLATGGGCIALSTPYGTGNWFHQTWVRAEARENEFLPIKLPWYVHPERDQSWRDRQDELLGDPRMAAQECDCDFSTSGDVVFYPEYLEFIEKTTIREPLERRGVDQNMVTKVKFMYENLPSWLKVDYEENNKLTLRLANGSQIKATSASSDAGRSEAVSLLLIDEAAFIENIGEIWASAQQTLATGGGCIALSTPYGTGNWFHQTWVRAEARENEFLPIKLPWYVHPERDQSWRDRQDELLGDPRMADADRDWETITSTIRSG